MMFKAIFCSSDHGFLLPNLSVHRETVRNEVFLPYLFDSLPHLPCPSFWLHIFIHLYHFLSDSTKSRISTEIPNKPFFHNEFHQDLILCDHTRILYSARVPSTNGLSRAITAILFVFLNINKNRR